MREFFHDVGREVICPVALAHAAVIGAILAMIAIWSGLGSGAI